MILSPFKNAEMEKLDLLSLLIEMKVETFLCRSGFRKIIKILGNLSYEMKTCSFSGLEISYLKH